MCGYFPCMYVYLVPKEIRRGSQILWDWSSDSCKPLCRCWESNWVLLTAEHLSSSHFNMLVLQSVTFLKFLLVDANLHLSPSKWSLLGLLKSPWLRPGWPWRVLAVRCNCPGHPQQMSLCPWPLQVLPEPTHIRNPVGSSLTFRLVRILEPALFFLLCVMW